MTLDDSEFIRRFLLHTLPEKFVRIRNFGFLSNKLKKKKLAKCRALLNVSEIKKNDNKNETWDVRLLRLTGIDPFHCNKCNQRKLAITETLLPQESVYNKKWLDSS